MFTRWRKLAAAAGALCFPLSLAHAAGTTDEPACPHTAPCIRSQELTDESSWFRTERDSWYQQYYGDAIDDTAPFNNVPLVPPQNQNAPTDQPNVIISDIENIDDNSYLIIEDEPNGECDSVNCPCHDILNSNNDASNDDQETETSSPIRDIESEFFDVYAPYVYPDANDESSKSEPTTQLTGTIEPIIEDSEEAWLDEWFCGDAESQEDSTPIQNEIDPIVDEIDPDSDQLNPIDDSIDSFDPNNGEPKYHMFYPGCDWSPYYPASKSIEQSNQQFPEDVRSA